MKKTFIAALAATTALCASAYTEETETMTVQLKDGAQVEYNVADIERVNFGMKETTVYLDVTEPTGEKNFRSESSISVFRYLPADNDQQIEFFFGTATDAADFAGLGEGTYMFRITGTQSSLYNGEVSLTDGAVSVVAYEFAEGEIVATLDQLTAGTLTSSRDTKKGTVTLELDATFADGTAVRAEYIGKPTDIESLDALFPPAPLSNELKYYGYSGDLSISTVVTSVTKKTLSSGWVKYTFNLENENIDQTYIEIDPALVGQVLNFATIETKSLNFCYNRTIQLSGPNDEFRNQGTEGTIQIIDNGDGKVTISANVTNKYKSPWGSGGTPERVEIYYNGTLAE